MNRLPATRLRDLLARISSPETMARVIDPALADLRLEWHVARTRGVWRARGVYLRGLVGLLQAVVLYSFVSHRPAQVAEPAKSLMAAAHRLLSVVLVTVLLSAIAVEVAGAYRLRPLPFVIAAFCAVLLAGVRRRARRRFTSDPFARTAFSTDVVNVAHVRVAGVGGAGLVILAFGVASQYPLTAVVTMTGAIGGLVLGLALIRLRRPRT